MSFKRQFKTIRIAFSSIYSFECDASTFDISSLLPLITLYSSRKVVKNRSQYSNVYLIIVTDIGKYNRNTNKEMFVRVSKLYLQYAPI